VVALSAPFGVYFILGLGYNAEWARIAVSAGIFNFAVLIPLFYLMRPETAVSITAVLVESFVLLRTYLFYRRRKSAAAA